MKPEKAFRLIVILLLAAALLAGTAGADGWKASEKNLPLFGKLAEVLKDSLEGPLNKTRAEKLLEEIRTESEADYALGRAILDHWKSVVMDSGYRMFVYRGEEEAETLERSGLDFSGRHAFVVLGYGLESGKMTRELAGRCKAAAAAARSFPDSILLCTGGPTGSDNPDKHTEAGEMKKYLVKECGIDAERIYTETRAMDTADNAVYSMKILKELGIESITLVTSDYHQRWGQILFNAAAVIFAGQTGAQIRIVGNYNYQARPNEARTFGCRAGANQLKAMLRREIDTGD